MRAVVLAAALVACDRHGDESLAKQEVSAMPPRDAPEAPAPAPSSAPAIVTDDRAAACLTDCSHDFSLCQEACFDRCSSMCTPHARAASGQSKEQCWAACKVDGGPFSQCAAPCNATRDACVPRCTH